MINTTLIKQKLQRSKISRITAALLLTLTTLGFTTSVTAQANQYQQQINQLNAANVVLGENKQDLLAEAGSLSARVNELSAQIAGLESQIVSNQSRLDSINAEIVRTQAELTKQRDLLKSNIKAMYMEGDMSTVEMLASSNDLSKYVDKEQYRVTVKNKIQATLTKIKDLQASLDTQKRSQEQLLTEQRLSREQIGAQRSEQTRLLALNDSQRAGVDAEIQSNTTRISQLRAQQAAENARLFGRAATKVDGSGYPWANAPFPNTLADTWGMYKRQCVSYTAWKVAASGRHMPYWGGRGNANQWDDNARAAGIPVDSTPRVGDVAVSNAGYYGHVMYVEAVYDDGSIYVSQYNAGWDGNYSEARIPVGNLVFIHF